MRAIKTLFVLTFCIFFSIPGYCDIKIGTLMYDPPFIISPRTGFDIDLSRIICTRLQLKCQFIPMTSIKLFQALKNGDVDLAISGIAISSLRKEDFIFSMPYMISQGQFLTLKKSPIDSIDELKGTTVGVIRDDLSGGVFYNYLVTNYTKNFNIKGYYNVDDMFAALSNKTISAEFLYRTDVSYWNRDGVSLFKTLGPVVPLGEGMAIIALPQKSELIKKIDEVIDQIQDDDTYLGLYKTYFSND